MDKIGKDITFGDAYIVIELHRFSVLCRSMFWKYASSMHNSIYTRLYVDGCGSKCIGAHTLYVGTYLFVEVEESQQLSAENLRTFSSCVIPWKIKQNMPAGT